MIRPEKRQAIYLLHQEGQPKKEIARLLQVDPKTVNTIVVQQGENALKERKDKIAVDMELLTQIYRRCDGWGQRIYEILQEEHGINIGYSTLTRLLRDYEIGKPQAQRCDQVPDVPGAEMQNDTSQYRIKIGGQETKVIASGLYWRYSKIRYLKFYFSFNRFKMKCFFDEALRYWGYSAHICIIDNTHLAVLHGTGDKAVMVPEMAGFAKQRGFDFKAHQLHHSNRKAGKERNFWTVETNFFPGRKFASLTDLNEQAFDWATNRYAHRPQAKTKLIPVELFEYEKPYLTKVSSCLEPPYEAEKRLVDQYGYIAVDGNYFWIPGTKRENLTVLHYADKIKVWRHRQMIIEYNLPDVSVKNKKIKPPGVNTSPYQPHNFKQRSDEEEKQLRAMGLSDYLDFALSKDSGVKLRHKFLQELYALSKKLSPELLQKTIQRALQYKVTNIGSLQRISLQLMQLPLFELPPISLDTDYQQRKTYQEGCAVEENALVLPPENTNE